MLTVAAAVMCLVQTPAFEQEVARRALPWLPPDLARQVERYDRSFRAGAEAAAGWPPSLHRGGGVEPAIEAQCQRLVAAIRSQRSFDEVVAGLGALAHLTLDASSPFANGPAGDPAAVAFGHYLPSAAPRIPLVFYGQQRRLIEGPDSGLAVYVDQRRRENRALAGIIRDDLDRVGGPPAWRRLDDRSSSFGAASVVLNHAVTDFVNLASWVWRQAGGLVPAVPAPRDTILVWKGEPRPRETTRPTLGFRQVRP